MVYEPVNSCITLLGQLDGGELITVEDLADDGALHPVQEAMAREHGSQCGFCTPGIVMSLFAHYHDDATAARPATRSTMRWRAICAAAPAIGRSSTPRSRSAMPAPTIASRRNAAEQLQALAVAR